jgi:hypothetical protein
MPADAGEMSGSEERLAWLEAQAERAYGLTYDVINPTAGAGHYSDEGGAGRRDRDGAPARQTGRG